MEKHAGNFHRYLSSMNVNNCEFIDHFHHHRDYNWMRIIRWIEKSNVSALCIIATHGRMQIARKVESTLITVQKLRQKHCRGNWMNLSWTLRMFFTFSSLVKHKPLTSFVWEIYWPNFISMCVYPSANRTSPTGNWIFVSQTPSCYRQRSSDTKLPIPSSDDELYVNDLKIVRGNSSAISHELFKNFSR